MNESLKKFLSNYSKKTISIDEIKQNCKFDSQKELKDIIDNLIQENFLIPMRTSGFTFEKPEIFLKYKIPQKDYSEQLEEIKKFINLDMSFYIRNPQIYNEDKEVLIEIENYFLTKKQSDIDLSINERSLEIFGDEKKLLSSGVGNILKRVNLSVLDFNTYESKEPFMYYKHSTSNKSGNVLIVENKDTWNTMKRILIDELDIIGYYFDAIIYGEGKKIISSFSSISDKEYQEFNSKDNTFFYFGDIDSTGIKIMDGLVSKYSNYKIKPFYPGYNYLLLKIKKAHIKIKENNKVKDDSHIDKNIIERYFKKEYVNEIYQLCLDNKIIPQEYLNNKVLRKGE